MKPSDALELVALVVERWPSARLDDGHMRRFAEEIVDLDAAECRAALDALYRSRREFVPTAGAVRYELAALQLGAPEWADVKRQLVKRHEALQAWTPPEWTCPHGECDGGGWTVTERDDGADDASHCRCWDERQASRRLADSLDPLVREFIADRYVTWGEVEAVGQGNATTLEAQMRQKWDVFRHRAVESRAFATIDAAPDLPRLEQAREEDAPRQARRRRSLERFSTAALPAAQVLDGEETAA